ncbi:MAG: hypothetical protein SFW67_28400 [Myxococcaceae bacterium]|nr:hypothetical protein [Myxococcaceae bacterium]
MIIELLAQKLATEAEKLDFSREEDLKRSTPLLDALERLVLLGQMNRAKAKDLATFAPKKFTRLLSDAELRKELKPVRDSYNFPKRGPRGPRDDVAPPPPGSPAPEDG